jgi:hypothetical protein
MWRSSFKPKLTPAARRLIDDVFARAGEPGGPKVASGEWRAGFAAAPFGPLRETNLDHEFVCDREGVVSYYVSVSSVARLPEAEREELRRELRRSLPNTTYRLALTANVWRANRL